MVTFIIFMLMVSAQYSCGRFLEKNKDDKESKMCTFKKSVKQTFDEHLVIIIIFAVMEIVFVFSCHYLLEQFKEFLDNLPTK